MQRLKTFLAAAAVAFIVGFFVNALVAHANPTAAQIGNGGTGTSTAPAYGQVLVGGKNGEYEYVATSTLGITGSITSVFGRTGVVTAQSGDYTTSLIPEGTNLYWTPTRFDNRLSATTSLPNILTLSGLSLPYSQLTGIPDLSQYFSLSAWYATTTNQLKEGSNNLYFTNARAISALTGQNISIFNNNAGYLTSLAGAASSTLLGDANTFSGVDSFTNAASNFSGTWQTFSPSHFQTALGFTAVPTTRNLNTTYPIQGGGDLSADRTITLAFGTTTANTWSLLQTFTSGLTSNGTATLATTTAYLEDMGGMVYNVKAYGAVGDGVTNDTNAVRAAVRAEQQNCNGYVFFPGGTYYLPAGNSGASFVPEPKISGSEADATCTLYLKGAGMYSTTLQTASTSPIIGYNYNGAGFHKIAQVVAEDMTFDGNYLGVASGAVAQQTPAGSAGEIINLTIPFTAANADQTPTGIYHKFNRVRFYRAAGFTFQPTTSDIENSIFDSDGQPDSS